MVKLLNPKPNILERKRIARNPGKGNRAETKPHPEKGLNKGYYLGACNRSACLAPGASWYNHGSLAYYCGRCAQELSNDSFNKREALFEWGHNLCMPGQYDREASRLYHEQHKVRLGNMLARQPGLELARIPTGTFELLLRQEIAADEIKATKDEYVYDFVAWYDFMKSKVPDIEHVRGEHAQLIRQRIYNEYAEHTN